MEGSASLPRRRALRRKQVEDEQRGTKRRRATMDVKVEDKENMMVVKKPRALFATPEQKLPLEVPRGLTRTVFAQAFEPSRPRSLSDEDDQDLINLVADSLVSVAAVAAQQPQTQEYTTTPAPKTCPSTPPSNSRKRRRED
jgi:hypothetical protein